MEEKSAIQKEVRALRATVEAEKKRHDAILAAINRSKEERDVLKNEVKTFSIKSENCKKTSERYESQMQETATKLDTVHHALVNKQNELVVLDSDFKKKAQAYESMLERKKTEFEAEKNKILSEIRALNTKKQVLKEECANLFEEEKVLKVRITTCQEEYERIVGARNRATAELGKLSADLADVRAQISASQNEIAKINETLKTVRESVHSAIAERDSTQTIVGTNKNELAELVRQKNKIIEETASLKQEYEATAQLRVTMVEKQNELNQREIYIKDQYKKIGLAYE
jgi:chromosome segregation ATPase